MKVVTHGSPEYDELVVLRRRVLRTPIGLDFTPEELAAEHDQTHAGVYVTVNWVMTLVASITVTYPDSKTAKIRQVAVAPEHQGKGYGRDAMHWAEDECLHAGVERIVLHARAEAVPFYTHLRYKIEGAEFIEVGIPHRRMTKAQRHFLDVG